MKVEAGACVICLQVTHVDCQKPHQIASNVELEQSYRMRGLDQCLFERV